MAGGTGALVSRVSEHALTVLDAAVDAAVHERVRLHRARKAEEIDVQGYLAGLEAVRNVEDALEPLRREQGAERARRFEWDHDRQQPPVEQERHSIIGSRLALPEAKG